MYMHHMYISALHFKCEVSVPDLKHVPTNKYRQQNHNCTLHHEHIIQQYNSSQWRQWQDVNDKTCGKQKGETEDHVIDMHSVSNSMKFDR